MLEAQHESTVGPPTNYLIVSKGQPLTHVSPSCELLTRWKAYYKEGETAGLDSEDANLAIQKEMKPVQMSPYDIELNGD
jgi:hypothetical protein